MSQKHHILLTGATGYVGGRLLSRLEEAGYKVRCLSRNPEYLLQKASEQTEVIQGDVLKGDHLDQAMEGIDTAFYLVHSMGTAKDFVEEDRQAARNFARAAKNAGIRKIIYLGGLSDPDEKLSEHLQSRNEVGETLKESDAQVIEFRASIIIGSGSLSFELIRSLVQKLPVMIWPRWVSTKAQPVSIEDVLDYLMAAMDLEESGNHIVEIGGPDQVSYGDLMIEYAKQRGLKRWTIPVPFLSPRLSSLWLGLVTPVYARIGRKLVESLKNPTVLHDDSAKKLFPEIHPRGLTESIERALVNEDQKFAQTRWSDSLSSSGSPRRWGGVRFGTRLIDSRRIHVNLPADEAFKPIQRIGGKKGWYYADWLWKIRGMLDLLLGGVGMRRGRPEPEKIRIGDTLDFWRVLDYEPNHLLLLYAEMKLPGRAWLEFEVTEEGTQTFIRQTAIFDPIGLMGLAYWYGIYPLHQLVFAGMLKSIATEAYQSSEKKMQPN